MLHTNVPAMGVLPAMVLTSMVSWHTKSGDTKSLGEVGEEALPLHLLSKVVLMSGGGGNSAAFLCSLFYESEG